MNELNKMPKKLLILLIISAAFPGCAWLAQPPAAIPPIKNPRIVERDLSPEPKAPARRVKSVDLAAAQSLDEGEQLVQVSTVAQPQAAPVAPNAANKAEIPAVVLAAKPQIPQQQWKVLVGDVRLANTFERWARESAAAGQADNYKILWDAGKHVLVDATPTYNGTLLEAIAEALQSPAIRLSAYPLEACVYQNSPPLVRITKRGEQTEACPEFKE